MAIAMLNEVSQSTPDIHDQVKAKMDIEGYPRAAMVFHSAAPMEGGGMPIFAVWESREDWERFREMQLPAGVSIGSLAAFASVG